MGDLKILTTPQQTILLDGVNRTFCNEGELVDSGSTVQWSVLRDSNYDCLTISFDNIVFQDYVRGSVGKIGGVGPPGERGEEGKSIRGPTGDPGIVGEYPLRVFKDQFSRYVIDTNYHNRFWSNTSPVLCSPTGHAGGTGRVPISHMIANDHIVVQTQTRNLFAKLPALRQEIKFVKSLAEIPHTAYRLMASPASPTSPASPGHPPSNDTPTNSTPACSFGKSQVI